MQHELLKRITVDQDQCFGKPCIRGHRIWLSLILDMLADGMTMEDVIENYPDLEREDILACLEYARP